MKSMKANFSHWAMIIRIAAFSGFESSTEMGGRGGMKTTKLNGKHRKS